MHLWKNNEGSGRIFKFFGETYLEKLLELFQLAKINVKRHWRIENEYSGNKANWLLVETERGLVKIGWRKRVISINWKDTGIEHLIEDDVTKDSFSCHAWSYEKAVEYLKKVYTMPKSINYVKDLKDEKTNSLRS